MRRKPLTLEKSVSYHKLAIDFIKDNVPAWLFHDDVVKALRLREIRMRNDANFRGLASHDGTLWLCPVLTTKFRSASPYSKPFGKSDMSPMGVLVHEMGHLAEYALRVRRVRYQDEWWSIAKDHKRTAITSYAKTHPMEDFAETFRLWALNPKLLKELCPLRHAFMTKHMRLLLGGKRTEFRTKRSDAVATLYGLFTFTKKEEGYV